MLANNNNTPSSSSEPFATLDSNNKGMYARTLLEYVCENGSKGYGWANADPDAEVVPLSPKTLLESDRYVCEICNQRERETPWIHGRCRTFRCTASGTRCCGFVEAAEEGDAGDVRLFGNTESRHCPFPPSYDENEFDPKIIA
nr:protein SHOOT GRAVITROPISM 5-like [Ipomoea batatas]